jgi:hypothetical protein
MVRIHVQKSITSNKRQTNEEETSSFSFFKALPASKKGPVLLLSFDDDNIGGGAHGVVADGWTN